MLPRKVNEITSILIKEIDKINGIIVYEQKTTKSYYNKKELQLELWNKRTKTDLMV